MLEITESVFSDDRKEVVEILGGLRHLGVRISIDDFGTGYSSLSRLRDLPVDELKIDRSFISQLGGDLNRQLRVDHPAPGQGALPPDRRRGDRGGRADADRSIELGL